MTDRARSPAVLRLAVRPGGAVAGALRRVAPARLPRDPGGPARGVLRRSGGAPAFVCEFHVAAGVRRKYAFPEPLFRSNGNAVFADFRAVREFAARMNERRAPGSPAVRAGELNAMGLIDEILHFVFRLYERTVNPGVLARGIAALGGRVGPEGLGATLGGFTEHFPPVAVFRGTETPAGWLAGSTDGRIHAEVSLEEILMLHLANLNPAFSPYLELFDEAPLQGRAPYADVVAGLRNFLRGETPFGDSGASILDFLEAPMKAHPESLAAQLGYIRDRWGVHLSEEFRRKILSSEDLSREDAKRYPAGGPGMVEAPDYRLLAAGRPSEYPETENFTHDTDWMPNVVLLAKNAYVWLHQLSRTHGREISRLDQVPDEELDRLAGWNFTSLWLIGVWHRSGASERIKRMTGNPEAAPSAYSLYEYEIAPDLGGEEAFGSLADRAWRRGIRLAADMVPNHTGIASRWMREHPDYFIQADHPPFPAYRFTGPDLSDDPSYQVRIEDGYWTRADAAVVFQRIDNATGRLRYVYHGNDGTNMPWNDTAQLDFLKAEVREAVIREILHVARKFSVIRFDAAMTLTKKHFHRLWYPHPGTGGDIPSRADHALLQEEFDRRFPKEFWREVVDRVNAEQPNTLLLAEAFWLLEGYFVRTLGMHRVYNSAFMHMLMKEDNALYRGAIRSTLHYNPEILKRYVNFLSNPDERTAIDQFGDGDKYFGVATLLVTLPGLPMFAHGQVEGFREKYGMEYRRDYHDEVADADLVRRHEREVFPLLRLRHLFSQTEHFELYDVLDPRGHVIEDVFAYSNMAGGLRAVVCYNNRYQTHAGTLKRSAGKLSGGAVRTTTLAEALRLRRGGDVFHLFREQRSGLEYVRTGTELHEEGLFVRLRAFESQVFLDFREVADADGRWRRLHDELKGGGVPDAERAARRIALRPFHAALSRLLDPEISAATDAEVGRRMNEVAGAMGPRGADAASSSAAATANLTRAIASLEAILGLPASAGVLPFSGPQAASCVAALAALETLFGKDRRPGSALAAESFDEWLIDEALLGFGRRLGRSGGTPPPADGGESPEGGHPPAVPPGEELALLLGAILTAPRAYPSREFFEGPAAQALLRVNRHDGTLYFHRESFELLVRMAALRDLAFSRGAAGAAGGAKAPPAERAGRCVALLEKAAAGAGYRLGEFLRYLESDEFLTFIRGAVDAPPRGA